MLVDVLFASLHVRHRETLDRWLNGLPSGRGCWLQIHGDPIEVIFRVLEPAEMEPAFTTTIPEDMWIQRGTSEVSKQKLAQKS